MEIKVIRAGILTTVQDLGRRGGRGIGMPVGGAMDEVALRVANLLVGNDEGAAGLEFTMIGPELEFSTDALVAVVGADFGGEKGGRPIAVRPGERLNLRSIRKGCRRYLAVAGGLTVDEVLGGQGTFLRGQMGGHEGRALKDGDVLLAEGTSHRPAAGWWVGPAVLPSHSSSPCVRVIRGEQADEFGPALFQKEYRVSPASDRMGIRLDGMRLARITRKELLSSAVAPGTIQVPPDGQPIVLMADAQTVGGYAKIAHVISVDLPLMAQLRPGDRVRFAEVSLATAHELWHERERILAMLREGLIQKNR